MSTDYFAGILGDNLDGLFDLGAIGGEVDRHRAEVASEQSSSGTTSAKPEGLSWQELYEAAKRTMLLKEGPDKSEKVRRAFEAYQKGFEARERP